MDLIVQIIAGIIAIIGILFFLFVRINKEGDISLWELTLKVFLGGISFSAFCAGLSMIGGTDDFIIAIILGGIGFVCGTLIKLSSWTNREIYTKRLFPSLTEKIRDYRLSSSSVDDNRARLEDSNVVSEVGDQQKNRNRLAISIFGTIFFVVVWAIIGVIGGGLAGFFWGIVIGIVIGIIVSTIGWLFGLYKPYIKNDE